MKKMLAMVLSVLLVVSLFAGCAKGDGGNASQSSAQKDGLKEGTKLSDIVDKLNEEIGLAMPGSIAQEMLNDLYGLDDTAVEDFSGMYTEILPGVDEVLIVKAKEGKIDDVKAALEKRKEDRLKEQYLPGMIEKAELGKVVVKGNYAALLIIGDEEKGLEKEISRAEEIFLSFFA